MNRLKPLDDEVSINRVLSIDILGNDSDVFVIDTTLDPTDVQVVIQVPVTTEEQDSLDEYQTIKQQFKDEYLTAVSTLQSHINEIAWTNVKIINAITFHAKVLLFVIKLLKKLLI